ncbi:ADP-ribosyltransferase [Actinoallomurus iriomotensis]|uniref:ADP ribosyltransferase domain-containing protein n=1 Tax=Actinoallomurus iriomotensis TaxID=478107 RepID=A0A9W6SBA9_9ACTN|nr:ADP-ribosyltransferase [Actinoallomurus iriomotensis]GLY90438.1 hypothetical protein Airi02_083670 [Actinoallomurus iriomotensis]
MPEFALGPSEEAGLFKRLGEIFRSPRASGGPLEGGASAAHEYKGLVPERGEATLHLGPPKGVPLDAPFGSRLVSPSYGDRIWGEYVEKMAGGHYMAIDTYSSNERYINRYLRDTGYFDRLEPVWGMAPTIRDLTLKQVQAIREVMRLRPVPDTIDVFRGVKMKPDLFTVPIEELPGTIQRDPAFLSTNLGDRPAYERDVILHLRVPEGTPGFYIEPISKMGEHELLLDAGRSWFAEDVLRRERQWHVYGWVLPD